MKRAAAVHLYHAVDTEGPLYESLDAKFGRLEDLYGITSVPRTEENFRKLQRGEWPLGGGLEAKVAQTLNGHLVDYNDTWDKVEAMLDRIFEPGFRAKDPDSEGRGWVFNWHCLDHVGYENNPRRRDLGYHKVFDRYRARLAAHPGTRDAIHWHFHPMSTYRDAHHCATSYVNSPELYQILCRKVLERSWFPTVFRAGFQTERPDSHWFLEQWVPFDVSNMALDDNAELAATIDFRNGRSGDWRRAPSDWSLYQPDHDDYQRPGRCRRWVARALNVMNRLASVDQREMDKAFARAASGLPTLVGMASHDFRNLETEVEHLRGLVKASAARFPGVPFKYCEGVEAFRGALWPDGALGPALKLELRSHPASGGDVAFIEVRATQGKVFGPQPFLAIKTRSGRFIHDNFDFDEKPGRWFYAFHGDTLPLEDVEALGVAANDSWGNNVVLQADLKALRG